MNRAICSWSGGKDSCFALMHAIDNGYQPQVLLTVLNEEGQRSRAHGLPPPILEAQAKAIGLPVKLMASSWQQYEELFTKALSALRQVYTATHTVFGDIDLQAHRDWEEKVCQQTGLTAIWPLWQRDRKELVTKMLQTGICTIIVSCNTMMGPSFLGKVLTPELITELEALGIDPCGENGEFHTLVLDAPLFHYPINVTVIEKELHDNYWFAGLQLTT